VGKPKDRAYKVKVMKGKKQDRRRTQKEEALARKRAEKRQN